MILGMTTSTYTLVHVAISLLGICSGFVVLFGLLSGKAARFLDCALSSNDRADQRDRLRLSV